MDSFKPGGLLGRDNQWTLGSQKLSHGLEPIRQYHQGVVTRRVYKN